MKRMAVRRRRAVAHLVFWVAIGAYAAGPDADLQFTNFPPALSPSALSTPALPGHLDVAISRAMDEIFADQFNSLRVMEWEFQSGAGNFNGLNDRATHAARDVLERSFLDGLRQATADSSIFTPLSDRQAAVASFVQDSVDTTEEESVSPMSMAYGSLERAWWNRLNESGNLHYGLRPFRADPYAFLSTAVRSGDRVLFLGNLRYRYSQFANHGLELALSVPLEDAFTVDVGTTYRFAGRGEEHKLAIKIFKCLKSGVLVHVGFQVDSRPQAFAGASVPW